VASIQNFYTSRDNNTDGNTYVGQLDRLWYNPNTNSIFVSDGSTPGGNPVALATGANANIDNLTVNTIGTDDSSAVEFRTDVYFSQGATIDVGAEVLGSMTVTGNLTITGDISPAAVGKIGGIQPGPGVVIGNTGILTIDSANLPVSFGNFFANNNILSIVNEDEDMILATQGDAEIQLVGNIGFFKSNGLPPNPDNRFFLAKNDGKIQIFVPDADPITGALEIIGSATSDSISPAQVGVMLHITGQPDTFASQYIDGINNFPNYIGRRYNGNVSSPTQVMTGNTIVRFSGQGYSTGGFNAPADGSISLDALEDFTASNQGAIWRFLVNPVGGNVRQQVANISVANGVVATQFNTSGTVSATGNVTTASTFVGNVSGLITRQIRNAGTIADGGTLTIDFATDDLINCVWNNGLTIAGSNYVAGRVVTVMALKGPGSGTDSITFSGFTANHTSTGTTSSSYSADVTAIIEFISTTTAADGVFIKV
jgi:hypothetical protein